MDVPEPARVVVGVHQSVAAYHALRYATAVARGRGATLVIVRALGFPAGRGLAPGVATATAADVMTEMSTMFAEALGGPPRDLTVRIVAREGDPGPALVETADRDTDILVIGGSVPRRLRVRVAPTARYCASHAACPVIIVPPPALARVGSGRGLARDAEAFLSAFDEPRQTTV